MDKKNVLMTVGEYAKSGKYNGKMVTPEHIRGLLIRGEKSLPSVEEVKKTVDGKFILVVIE